MFGTETTASVDYRALYEQTLEKCAEREALISSLQKERRTFQSGGVRLPNQGYEWLSNLQYKVKSLTERVRAFESGEKYIDMKATSKALLAGKDREIQRLKAELADANSRIAKVRGNWSQVFDDVAKEHAKELAKKDRALKEMEKRALKAETRCDELKDRLLDKTRELYQVKTELEDERGKTLNLKAQISRDHENSSISSSLKPNRKKMTNNRGKSGKSPGGQMGHKHHPRKRRMPTARIDIPAPEEFAGNPEYARTGRTITKQLVGIQVNLTVTGFSTPEFRNTRTGTRVHAKFPGGLVDDVTYDGSVKAFAFLLNSHCNVSISKVSDFLCELTGGGLRLSTGMICGLTREFSQKTEPERKKAFADLLLEPVVGTDFTTVRVNGKNMNVLVCATPTAVQYFARERKGHEGVKGTPVETYRGVPVHDHDKTFFNYGDDHQGCHDHILRYLKSGMENEPNLKWNRQMRELIQEMIHFRKHLDPEDDRNPDGIDPGRVAALETKYDEVLNVAKEEYEYEPPSKYYTEGFNLYKRLSEHKRHYLLFLHDRRVPYSNSLSERLLRVLKRKAHQVMAFRSFEGLGYLCDCLGEIASLRAREKNLYESAGGIFDRRVGKR